MAKSFQASAVVLSSWSSNRFDCLTMAQPSEAFDVEVISSLEDIVLYCIVLLLVSVKSLFFKDRSSICKLFAERLRDVCGAFVVNRNNY